VQHPRQLARRDTVRVDIGALQTRNLVTEIGWWILFGAFGGAGQAGY
jgi:hypothetical protein